MAASKCDVHAPSPSSFTLSAERRHIHDQEQIEALRFHGIKRLPDGTRDVQAPCGKFNMSDVSSAIGLRQLARLDGFLARRAALAERYFERFPRIPGAILPPSQMPRQSWNMFCVLFPFAERGMERKTFRDRLHERGITTGVSYEALHTTTLGRSLGYRDGDFPNAERIGRETLSLPLHVVLSNDDVDYVCRTIAEIWESPDERN